MARVIEERWVGIGYDVIQENIPVLDNGQPVFDGNGIVRTIPHTTLVFIVNEPPHAQWIVRIPFTDDNKTELIAKLTGGIVIANGGPSI